MIELLEVVLKALAGIVEIVPRFGELFDAFLDLFRRCLMLAVSEARWTIDCRLSVVILVAILAQANVQDLFAAAVTDWRFVLPLQVSLRHQH